MCQQVPKTDNPKPVLAILVDGMGRINLGHAMSDWKRITDRVALDGITVVELAGLVAAA